MTPVRMSDVNSDVVQDQGSDCTYIKYLGIILSEDKSIKRDIDKVINSLLGQFNIMYIKCYQQNYDLLLIKSFTSSIWCRIVVKQMAKFE